MRCGGNSERFRGASSDLETPPNHFDAPPADSDAPLNGSEAAPKDSEATPNDAEARPNHSEEHPNQCAVPLNGSEARIKGFFNSRGRKFGVNFSSLRRMTCNEITNTLN